MTPGYFVSTFLDSLNANFLPVKGELTADGKISGPTDKLKSELIVSSPQLNLGTNTVNTLTLSLNFSGKRLKVKKLEFESLGGKINAEGFMDADSLMNHEFELSAKSIGIVNIKKLTNMQNIPYDGVIDAGITSKGPLAHPENFNINAALVFKSLSSNDSLVKNISANLIYQEGDISAIITQDKSIAKGNFTFLKNIINGSFSADIPDIEEIAGLAGIKDIKGSLGLNGTVNGNPESPSVSVDLSGNGIKYMNFPADSLHASFEFIKNIFKINALTVSGKISETDSRPFGIKDLRGGITYKAGLSGSPGAFKGFINAEMQKPGYAAFELNSAKIAITSDGEKAVLDSLVFYGDSLMVKSQGEYFIKPGKGILEISVPPAGKISVDVKMPALNDATFTTIANNISIGKITKAIGDSLYADGNLDFSFILNLNKGKPYGNLDFFADSLRYQDAALDSVRGKIELKDGFISMNPLDAYLKDNKASAQGTIKLTEKGGIDSTSISSGKILLENMDISVLSPLLKELEIKGKLTAKTEWEGTLGRPSFNGSMSVDGASLGKPGEKPLIDTVNLTVSFRDSALIIENASGTAGAVPITLTGSFNTEGWKTFRGEIAAKISDNGTLGITGVYGKDTVDIGADIKDFQLSSIEGFIPEITELKGNMESSVKITGPVKDPQINGTLLISGLEFRSELLPASFTGGNAALRFDKRSVFVDSFTIKKDKGYGYTSGYLSFEKGQISDINFTSRVKNFTLSRPKIFSLKVTSADIKYAKSGNAFLLNGTINLGETKYKDNIKVKEIISMLRPKEKPPAEISDIIRKTKLDIRLSGGDNIWIDNNLARIRITPELQFTGSPIKPNMTGRLTAEEGYIMYFDREFKIQSAVLDFADPNKINPIIDLRSSTEVTGPDDTDYTINLNITGPLDTAKIAITSTPSLDEANILSLLTVGATREQLMGNDSQGFQAGGLLKDRLEQISSGALSNYVALGVAGAIGLDKLSLEGNIFNFGNSAGPTLKASEKISKRLEITYTTNVGQLNRQGVSLDYSFSKKFSVEGYTDQIGKSGIDLKMKIKFK